MNKFSWFTEDVTDPKFDGYDVLLTIYFNNTLVFKKVYGFESKNDTWAVESIAEDIIKLMEDKENGKV